jgi:hypothetical protein
VPDTNSSSVRRPSFEDSTDVENMHRDGEVVHRVGFVRAGGDRGHHRDIGELLALRDVETLVRGEPEALRQFRHVGRRARGHAANRGVHRLDIGRRQRAIRRDALERLLPLDKAADAAPDRRVHAANRRLHQILPRAEGGAGDGAVLYQFGEIDVRLCLLLRRLRRLRGGHPHRRQLLIVLGDGGLASDDIGALRRRGEILRLDRRRRQLRRLRRLLLDEPGLLDRLPRLRLRLTQLPDRLDVLEHPLAELRLRLRGVPLRVFELGGGGDLRPHLRREPGGIQAHRHVAERVADRVRFLDDLPDDVGILAILDDFVGCS